MENINRVCGTKSLISTVVVAIAAFGAMTSAYAQLEEVVVTAQKREVGLQSAPVAVSAFTGENLERNRIFSSQDLARSTAGISLTEGSGSPVDLELNIRGITNTRLDSPSAESAVGTFVDDVYLGRNGDMNTDWFDIERIEVIRGPQGVLLGKSVVGGALSIITRKPEFENGGGITVAQGNYDSRLLSGYVTGPINDSWAGRISLQSRSHDGYGYDVLHDRELDDIDSTAVRAQLLYQPSDGGVTARVIADYSKDTSNGINVVAIADSAPSGLRPWSTLRTFLGITDPRVSIPEETVIAGESNSPINQYLIRESTGLTVNIEKDFNGFVLNSVTSFRDVRTENLYDQTGGGPDVLDDTDTFGVTFNDFLAFNPTAATFLFSEPVNEEADISAFSQEFRLTSTGDGPFEWLAGVFFKSDEIDKLDRFTAEIPSGVLGQLGGESHWINQGENTNIGVFGQFGYSFTDKLKLTVGARWSSDKKEGNIQGIAVDTGDRFNPADPIPAVPLLGAYQTAYGETWKKTTPQATLEFAPNDDLFFYGTISTGFKGGYFQDTAPNAFAASFPTRPEEVTNYEVGAKIDFAGGRARVNAAAFLMDYTDLQVEQTNQDCLCNLTENAADAEITGLEVEFTVAATDQLLINISGSFLQPEYKTFIEASGIDSSGKTLQRTPETQYAINLDYTVDIGQFGEALNFYVNYAWQDDMPWQPSNANIEDAYGLLDARVSFAPEGKPWAVSVYGKNLSDELYRTNIIPFFGEEVSKFGAPRTYGAEFRYSFE